MSDSVKKYKEMWGKSDVTYEVEPTSTHDFKEPINPRKNYPMYSGLLKYFPNALREVSHCSWVGQQQHNPDKPLAWDRSKSGDELDAMLRHLTDHAKGIEIDEDGVYHLVKCSWRILGMTEKFLEKKNE